MKNVVSLKGLKPHLESLAVAGAKRVLAALADGPVLIEDIGLDDAQWSEMVAYLARRGVQVRDNSAYRPPEYLRV